MHTFKISTLIMLLLTVAFIHGCGTGSKTSPSAAAAKDSLVIDLVGQDSVTVLDLLSRSHRVETKATAMGVFVTAIDSIANSSAGNWVYSVNDTMPEIASDKLRTHTGDRVKWHFRKQ